MNSSLEIDIDGIKLRMTCLACPEQYDATDGRGRACGYLRLRFGRFTVSYPGPIGEVIYEHEFDDGWQGSFNSGEERSHYLAAAVQAIRLRRRNGPKKER